MKKILAAILTFFCLSFPAHKASAAEKIGKVDLGLVFSLHPQMALFDFDRMGFFKIPLGLSAEEFAQRLQELKNQPIPPQFATREEEVKSAMNAIDRKKAGLHEKLQGASLEVGKKVEVELDQLAKEHLDLRNQLLDLEYQKNCPDLTEPDETRKILAEVEAEVMKQVAETAKKKGYDLVLNNSITVPMNYPINYDAGTLYGIGVPGIDYSLFYAFLANRDHVLPSDENPESRNLINWLELINFPRALNMLPIKPYPLVLHGGEDFSAEVIAAIYQAKNIDKKVTDTLCSILAIIKKHDEKLDVRIESIVAPK